MILIFSAGARPPAERGRPQEAHKRGTKGRKGGGKHDGEPAELGKLTAFGAVGTVLWMAF